MAAKKKILIIDDDPAICDSVQAILNANGYETACALSGLDGLAAFRGMEPAAVLCDMMMEDIDAGVKVAKIMKEERPAIPVFLLSTIGDVTSETVGIYNLGFSGVFQKPVDFDLLLSSLARQLKAK
jgi:DNA-binding NtrC family response regulator